jgi:hypothetical protein
LCVVFAAGERRYKTARDDNIELVDHDNHDETAGPAEADATRTGNGRVFR